MTTTDITALDEQKGQGEPVEKEPAETRGASRRIRTIILAQRQGLLVILIAVATAMSLASPFFLTVQNLASMASIAGLLGLMAVAQTFLVVSGGLDISVGSVVTFTGTCLVLLVNGGLDPWVAAGIALAIAAAIGALNGLLVVVLGVNPLIATLGTMSVFLGLAAMLTTSVSFTSEHPSFRALGIGKIAGIPVVFWVFVVVLLVAIVIERFTRLGREISAIGGNSTAARFAGLRVRAVPFGLYVTSSLSAGGVAIFLTAQLQSASPNIGSVYTLQVITAVILGGASLAGGRGSVVGTVVAVAFLAVLGNGFALLSVSSFAQTVILGVALIFAVLVDQLTRRAIDRRTS